MAYLFSDKRKTFLAEITKSEKELNKYISDNWSQLFPRLIFIRSEFQLRGVVRGKDGTGWVDILAFNPSTNHFVVVELKKDKDKNIRIQASDYRDYIEDNFERIYLRSIEDYNAKLPRSSDIDRSDVEIILIAKEYYKRDLKEIDRKEHHITFVKYNWFKANGEHLLYYEYLNNEPSPSKPYELDEPKIVEEPAAGSISKKITPVNYHNDCIKKLQKQIGQKLLKVKGVQFQSENGKVALTCAISKQYKNGGYWYAFHPHQKTFLKNFKKAFVAFGCGSPKKILMIPFGKFEPLLKDMRTTTRANGKTYWHIHINEKEKKLLLGTPRNVKSKKIDIEEYLL